MGISRLHRPRRIHRGIAAGITVVAVAAVIATAGLAASPAPGLTLHVSPVATIGSSGSELTIRGSASCTKASVFWLSVVALEPTGGASVHGVFPQPGQRAPTCKPPRKSFKIVATQQGEKKPQALKKSRVRVCFIIHSWRPHAAWGLNARCVTLRASR